MSFANKANGREYINKSNPNPNKGQTMNYRNTLTNTQYSNSSNGDSYPYDDKSQHSCNSPKVMSENHGVAQHNSCPRDPYYKNSNPRTKQYHNKIYNDKHVSYYNQRPSSPEDIVIPEIEHLREFIKEQADRFKLELSRHECQTSNSPSPGVHQYTEHSNNRFNKSYGSLGRTGNGLPVSHSLGSIVNSSNNVPPLVTPTVSPSCTDNLNRHPDARIGSNSFVVVKSGSNGYNYSKQMSQNSGKPSQGLTRNLSHDDTFSKSPAITNNKNRNDSPSNNVDKTVNNKTQFPSPTGSAGSRQDPKKVSYRTNPYTFATGANPAMHQMNQNNSVTALSLAIEQQSRPTMSAVVRNGITNGSTKLQNRRNTTINSTTTTKMEREADLVPNGRAVVSIAETGTRRISHSGSTTDSQDIAHSAIDTPTAQEQFFTPDPSASPCSTRSSPDAAAALNLQPQRGPRKTAAIRVTNNE